MIYKNMSMHELLDNIKNKTLICFGAGRLLTNACVSFSDISFFDKIDFIVDNDPEKHSFTFSESERPVYSIEDCLKQAKKEPVLLITLWNFTDVLEQLDSIAQLADAECFIYSFVQSIVKPYQLPKDRFLRESIKIPKTIHYCWFGGNPIRDDFAAYIETWKKNCPAYEIVRWDESNYNYKQNEYMYEAYKHQKWGFVSDYARLEIIYRHGGIYLDTDVELIRNIDDLLCDDAFCGFEIINCVGTGVIGSIAGFPLMEEQLKQYDDISFLNKDGSLNLTPSPNFFTELLRSKGLAPNNTLQNVQGMMIYPSDVLAPLNWLTGLVNITENTYMIHHYSATWWDVARREKIEGLYKKCKILMESF